MAIEINKYSIASTEILPCYEERQGQESRAYLHLDLNGDGEMWVGYKLPSDYSWSASEHSGYMHTFRIPNNLTPQGYNDLLDHPTIKELAELMVKEAEEYYDGSNYRMRLSQVGEDARETLERLCESIDCADYQSLDPWCADMYLQHVTYQDLTANGGTHEEIAERIVVEARKDGIHLSAVDVENRLDEMQEEVEGQGVTTKYCILTTDDSVGYWTGDTEPEIGAKVTLCVPTENGATQWEAKVVKEILESEKLES